MPVGRDDLDALGISDRGRINPPLRRVLGRGNAVPLTRLLASHEFVHRRQLRHVREPGPRGTPPLRARDQNSVALS
jgi:hypothetical protein